MCWRLCFLGEGNWWENDEYVRKCWKNRENWEMHGFVTGNFLCVMLVEIDGEILGESVLRNEFSDIGACIIMLSYKDFGGKACCL